jgi:hypothetical protein
MHSGLLGAGYEVKFVSFAVFHTRPGIVEQSPVLPLLPPDEPELLDEADPPPDPELPVEPLLELDPPLDPEPLVEPPLELELPLVDPEVLPFDPELLPFDPELVDPELPVDPEPPLVEPELLVDPELPELPDELPDPELVFPEPEPELVPPSDPLAASSHMVCTSSPHPEEPQNATHAGTTRSNH